MSPAPAGLAAVAAVAAHELIAYRLARPAARAGVRAAAAVTALALARSAGLAWPELGLGRADLAAGARLGGVAGGCAAAAVMAAAALPATRGVLRDERAAPGAGPQALAAALARTSFAVALPEEIVYRSALLGLRLRRGSRPGAAAWTSAWFALSHVLPTLATMHGTAAGRRLAGRPLRQIAFVAGNVAVTGAAGAAFAALRLRSGSVLASVIAHAAVNSSGLLAGRLAHVLGGSSGSDPMRGG